MNQVQLRDSKDYLVIPAWEDPERREALKNQVKGGLVVAFSIVAYLGIKSVIGD